MQIIVTGRHVELTQPIEQYAIKKCDHLEKFRDHVQSIELVLDKVHVDFEVEAKVEVPHHPTIVGKSSQDDLYAAIDQAVDKVERQLHDWKEKIQSHK
ncbi:MAG: ribosome-associated translation inhibitor RaiA [Phycisphaera sp. TMED9]|nr:MAG: ribosome-associated translation inhibitor RaiA [Phycisphaera sp. TMED9]